MTQTAAVTLRQAIEEIMVRKDVVERTGGIGFVRGRDTPARCAARIEEETIFWKEIAATSAAMIE